MPKSAPRTAAPQPFAGFDVPRQNWFKMPSAWTDITAGIKSLAELKVIEYVLKHTWGYQEYGLTKLISVDEFMQGRRRKDGSRMDRGTGLSKPSVIAGIKNALKHGFLVERVDDSDKGRVKKYYALRMYQDFETDDPNDGPPTGSSDGSGGGWHHQNRLPPAPVEDPPHADGEVDIDPMAPVWSQIEAESSSQPEAENEGEKGGVKNLYPLVKKVDPPRKESLPRTEKDTLERKQQKDTSNNNNIQRQPSAAPDKAVVVALQTHGIGATVAKRLSSHFPRQHIETKIAYLDFVMEAEPDQIKKPAAWLRRAIEDDYSAPDGFVSAADREMYQEEEKGRNGAVQAAQERHRARCMEAESARAEKIALRRTQLRLRYSTSAEAVAIWEEALADLRFTAPDTLYECLMEAEVLQLLSEEETTQLTLAVFHRSHWQQLQHPGYQAALRRTLKQITRRAIDVDFVLLADEALETDVHEGDSVAQEDASHIPRQMAIV